MKNKLFLWMIAAFAFAAGKVNGQYIDLSTGQEITVVKHHGTGMMYDTKTQRPVYLYVNTATKDTIYGRTGAIVNGRVMRTSDGKFAFTDEGYIYDNGEYRLLRESDSTGYKKKMQADGDVKVKYGDYKRKVDGNGDLKVKKGEAKLKDYADGREKVKDGTYRKKIDGEGNYREGDDSTKIKVKVDGSAKLKDERTGTDYKGKIDDDGAIKVKENGEKRKIKKDKIKVKKEDENQQ